MADFVLWSRLIVLSMFIVMTLNFIFISDSHTFLTCELFALQTSSPNLIQWKLPSEPTRWPGSGGQSHSSGGGEPAFPHTELAKLDDMINRLGLVSYIWSNYAYNYIRSTGDELQGYWYEGHLFSLLFADSEITHVFYPWCIMLIHCFSFDVQTSLGRSSFAKGWIRSLLEAAIDLCKKGNALFLGLVYHLIFLLFSFIVLLSSSRISITFICIILSFHFALEGILQPV